MMVLMPQASIPDLTRSSPGTLLPAVLFNYFALRHNLGPSQVRRVLPLCWSNDYYTRVT